MTGAVIVVRQNKLMRRFEESGALAPDSARSLKELDVRDSWIFQSLVSREVFVESAPGRYYMSPAQAADFVQSRKKRAYTTTAILVIVFIIVMYLTNR